MSSVTLLTSSPRARDKLSWREASGWVPFALVSAAMLYAGLVPTLLRRRPDRLRYEIQQVIEPARRLARTRQASHAIDVSAYRAYVISHDTRLLDRSREARARTEASGAELLALARQVDLETTQAAAVFDQTIRESHAVTARRAEVDLQAYRANLPSLQDRFQATQDAAERLDALLARKMDERVREAQRLILYQDLGNVALSLLGGAAVLAVTRLVRREQRARAAAEAAVRSRDQVVSIVSHDLRNPLSNVSVATSFLLDMGGFPGQEWATARPHLEMIKRGCDRMNRMILDLLDVARIESGRLAIERTPVAVESLMDEVATTLRPAVERRGQRLDRRVASGLPAVSVDRDRVLQVFSNLVDNAVKFTAAGGTITVTADGDHRAVHFCVSDTGSGIPPEHVPYLFDRFWQASRTDRRGIGLGLAIVKALVEAHGGHMTVESEPGRGTTFRFSLPVTPPAGLA
jgi:signal transduction histidine kinase